MFHFRVLTLSALWTGTVSLTWVPSVNFVACIELERAFRCRMGYCNTSKRWRDMVPIPSLSPCVTLRNVFVPSLCRPALVVTLLCFCFAACSALRCCFSACQGWVPVRFLLPPLFPPFSSICPACFLCDPLACSLPLWFCSHFPIVLLLLAVLVPFPLPSSGLCVCVKPVTTYGFNQQGRDGLLRLNKCIARYVAHWLHFSTLCMTMAYTNTSISSCVFESLDGFYDLFCHVVLWDCPEGLVCVWNPISHTVLNQQSRAQSHVCSWIAGCDAMLLLCGFATGCYKSQWRGYPQQSVMLRRAGKAGLQLELLKAMQKAVQKVVVR